VGRTLHDLQKVDPAAANLLEQHEQAVNSLSELQGALSHYLDKVEVDPERLREMEERLNLILSLKRKYGASTTDVIEFGQEARRKLQNLEQRDAELARINRDLAKIDEAIGKEGRALSQKRTKVIPQLCKATCQQLGALGFRQSRFEITLSTLELNSFPGARIPASGLDTVEFQFAPNPGEPARPLRAIASSGELARVMLALKTVLAAEDRIPVLVFDEVDANVGGDTAHAVGEKMQQIARQRQVLCITHLPQVAASASAHFVAVKEVRNGRTVSGINLLDPKERVNELARMLGGQSDAARKHAEALIAESKA
jgi:DNA repair protein RecN (Recombination protein N)